MHPIYGFSIVQVLWTLSFAALLVLLVVLLGRERYKAFKWFTIGIVLMTLRLLVSKLLYGKMAPVPFYELFIPLSDLSAIVSVVVLVELARRAFAGLGRRAWIVGTLALLAVGGVVLAKWGPWPAWKTLTAGTTLAVLGLMQTASQKIELLSNVIAVELGVLVLLFGRRFKAAWRSHTQAVIIGLSTVAIAQMLRDGVWQRIAMKAAPQTQAELDHLIGMREKLSNANEVVFLAVVIWWIACLWLDEPGMSVDAVSSAGALQSPAAPRTAEIAEPESE